MPRLQHLIFVSGTGRSGTHLIGRTISSHPDIQGRIENPDTFDLITSIATTQDYGQQLPNLVRRVRLRYMLRRILRSTDRHVLEKSHPSLWLVDFLMRAFQPKFVFVHRDVEAVTSSMLEHRGVLSWYDKLPLDKPNRFLGITRQNAAIFHTLSIEEKCALRWVSHQKEIRRLYEKYPKHIFILHYNTFLTNPQPVLEELAVFLGVPNSFAVEPFQTSSIDKWKSILSAQQVERIRDVIHSEKD